MALPGLLTDGLIVFAMSFIVIMVVLYARRSQIKEPRKIREKIGTIIAFSVAIATAAFFGINALYYGITLQPYPGESLDTSLRAGIVFGAVFLVWFAVKSVLDEFDKFFESAEANGPKPKDAKSQPDTNRLLPKLNYKITQTTTSGTKRQLPSVGFNISNDSDLPTRFRVFAEIFLNHKSFGYPSAETGHYTGERVWNLNARGGLVNGNFSLPIETVKKTDNLTIVVTVVIVGNDETEIATLLPLGWTYMFDENEWYFEPAPRSKVQTSSIPVSTGEPQAIHDYVKIAQDWVHERLPTLQLLKWETKLNEVDGRMQLVGIVWDDHKQPHSFDVRMTKAGNILYKDSKVS